MAGLGLALLVIVGSLVGLRMMVHGLVYAVYHPLHTLVILYVVYQLLAYYGRMHGTQ